jgi:hypothetical protein
MEPFQVEFNGDESDESHGGNANLELLIKISIILFSSILAIAVTLGWKVVDHGEQISGMKATIAGMADSLNRIDRNVDRLVRHKDSFEP